MELDVNTERYLPLNPKVFLMLTGLAERPQHGYALMQRIRELDPRERGIGPATLYRTLDRLEADGLIESVGEDPEQPRRGDTYALSDLGRAVLRAEAARVDDLAAHARAALDSLR